MVKTKSYEDWPEKKVKLSQLFLDPENPRLDNPSPDNEQRAICRELIEKEKVEDLANNIVSQGYYPTETMVVIQEKRNHYTVLEGNRRVAALKALQNPLFAPPGRKNRFEALQTEGKGRVPETVKVVVAPDRLSARPLILNKHTTTGIQKWTLVSQAKFIDAMVADGFSADQMAKQMCVSVNRFLELFRIAKLYNIAVSLDLPADVKAIVEDHHRFSVTVLQRLADSVEGREWLGLEPDAKEGWVIRTDTQAFKKALSRIVTDIALEKITSRTINNTKDRKVYLDGLGAAKPAKKRGKPTSASRMAATKKKPPKKTVPKAPPRKTTTKPDSLLPPACVCDLDPPRIHKLIDELQGLDMNKYPNACALVYRTFLDAVTTSYFDEKGFTEILTKRLSSKSKKPAHWMPSLNQMLTYLVNDADKTVFPVTPTARKALGNFVSGKGGATLDTLNGYAHNQHESPNIETLKNIGHSLHPVVSLLMQKPS